MKKILVLQILTGEYKDICCPIKKATLLDALIALCNLYGKEYKDINVYDETFDILKDNVVIESHNYKFNTINA